MPEPFTPRLTLSLFNLEPLALQIKFPIENLQQIINNKVSKITTFIIEKKVDGKTKSRTIHNPSNDYKIALKNINKYLLSKGQYYDGVCGGVKKKTLKNMTNPHCGKEAIYIIDLKDFYPSISSERVKNFFRSCRCSNKISNILTDLTTYNNQLPQGFPTSTALANLIASKLDYDHLNICRKHNLVRTRWIDDIAFSGRIKDIEKAIPKIDKAVAVNHFNMNTSKCKFTRRKGKPIIVGLNIDKHKPYISNSIIDHIRDTIQIAIAYDLETAAAFYGIDIGNRNLRTHLQGIILYICNYNPIIGQELGAALAQACKE